MESQFFLQREFFRPYHSWCREKLQKLKFQLTACLAVLVQASLLLHASISLNYLKKKFFLLENGICFKKGVDHTQRPPHGTPLRLNLIFYKMTLFTVFYHIIKLPFTTLAHSLYLWARDLLIFSQKCSVFLYVWSYWTWSVRIRFKPTWVLCNILDKKWLTDLFLTQTVFF